MNSFSKLILSAEEQQLVNNSQWILTKRVIIEKIDALLGSLSEEQKEIIAKEKDWLPETVMRSTPKISKGENYLQLPYLILDYPRCFDTENIFAVRTMFWWGNFFSMALQLSGTYKQMFQEKIIENVHAAAQDLFICTNESQWQHHFEAENYVEVKGLQPAELRDIILKKPFIKLAVKFPLQQWDDVPALLDGSFKKMIEMLKP